tara:strand:- start:1629 stop:2225 length:597 start_codon:yes stop_codon:yes gene_type:complete
MPMRLQAIDRFLVVVLGLVFIGLSWPAKANALSLEDYKVTPPCKEQLDAAKISTFEIREDEINLVLVNRSAAAKVEIKNIRFEPFMWGIMIKTGEQHIVHCLPFTPSFFSFALAEPGHRTFHFFQEEYKTTEIHLHSFIGCGTSCHFARVETIMFFDKVGEEPHYAHVEDTVPNEYPSRWYRSYLTGDEQRLFDNANS